MPPKSWPGYDMTYREFMKRHRIPDNELLSLLWDTSDEWRAVVGSISSHDRRHMLLETAHLGVKATEVNGELTIEDPGKPVRDSAIDAKRARTWLVKNGYEEHQPKKRHAILQKQAAALIGVSVKEISRWDKGEHTPPDYPGRHNVYQLEKFAKEHREKRGKPPLQPSEYLS